jgi:hypothetical protein
MANAITFNEIKSVLLNVDIEFLELDTTTTHDTFNKILDLALEHKLEHVAQLNDSALCFASNEMRSALDKFFSSSVKISRKRGFKFVADYGAVDDIKEVIKRFEEGIRDKAIFSVSYRGKLVGIIVNKSRELGDKTFFNFYRFKTSLLKIGGQFFIATGNNEETVH